MSGLQEPGAPLGHLYRAHRLPLVRLAALLVGDLPTAEDVVQDAFAAVWHRRHSLHDATSMAPYIRRAVVNKARSVIRRRRVANALRPEREQHAPSAEHEVLLSFEHRELLTALHRLAPRQKEILVLRYWAGLSEAEIARAMGITRGAVKSMSHRSLAALRRRLENGADGVGHRLAPDSPSSGVRLPS
ncbi:SigE family RNA polymerase sigma factor [Streptomyces sp. NPDC047108]|uniref:RNA polymerase sigma factor n=1 Tax=Streptomyces sp. NPDC047108 TaxID=3155025 RepID=UPI003402831C